MAPYRYIKLKKINVCITVLIFIGENVLDNISPKKNQNNHLSMPGFEPAISRFVAERVILGSTWICNTRYLTLEIYSSEYKNNAVQ